jgi:hypothetical protein
MVGGVRGLIGADEIRMRRRGRRKPPPVRRRSVRMSSRRLFALAPLAAAIALAAPAAAQATVTSLTFPAGTVTVEDPSPASANEVRFTMPNADTLRAFVDIRGAGESHIALGSLAALGVEHAVYTTQSIAGCQVYTGTTFGETDRQVTAAGLVFDVRKDELAPNITVALDDSAGGAANCAGFDGSPGRPVTFDPTKAVTGLQWTAPGDATGLRAVAGPGAITLFWTPPADAVGVRYEVSELQPNGTFVPFDQAVGSSFTINGLAVGVPHTYRIRPFRFWGGQLVSPNPSAPATGAAGVPEAPATAGAPATGAAGGTTTATKAATAAKKKAAAATARPAAPRAWKAKASGRRVLLSLPKLAKGQRIEIMRATKTKYGRIATTTRRSYTDRKVKRGATYRYRLVLVSAAGERSLPSKTIAVRVR